MIEVDSSEVIRVVLQFLRDNNLPNSVKTLCEESGVHLNILKDKQKFIEQVSAGKWDAVLEEMDYNLCLSARIQEDLYRTMYLDFARKSETSTARVILRESVLTSLAETAPEEYLDLESFLQSAEGADSEYRKYHKALLNTLDSTLEQYEPNRLLQIIQDSIKLHAKSSGDLPDLKYDIFKGVFIAGTDGADAIAHTPLLKIPGTYVLCTTQDYLVVGDASGLVQVLDWTTGLKHPDFEFSDQIRMACGVTCIHERSGLLAVGSEDGSVAVWRIDPTGLIKKISFFDKTMKSPVTSLCFSTDLIACSGNMALVLGLKSGGVLRQLSAEPIQHVTSNGSVIYGASRSKLYTFNDKYEQTADYSFDHCKITHICPTSTGCIINGYVLDRAQRKPFGNGHAYSTCISPKGMYVYQAIDKGLSVYTAEGQEVKFLDYTHIESLCAHPTYNLVAFCSSGTLYLLKP